MDSVNNWAVINSELCKAFFSVLIVSFENAM